ncbi:GNAT family N-acetyltransferase [Kribbella sp. NPDC050281]|uniref:GNAT family N-acetyltransferase n=1 Tax=Kribbella sp. NPDC050281 TaxID=3155515 RepID=UPI0034040EA9
MTAVLEAEVREARKVADAVARARDLTIRELHEPIEHRDAERLLGRVWRTGPASPPVSGDLMRALSHAGAYVAGAFLDGELVGVTAAFLANRPGSSAELHSHITGVVSEVRGRQVGWALKLHQRAWSLERGIESIAWTFDPLVRRNAYFNLTKLGAHVVSYLVDFYGEMADGVNAGQGSDRLLVRWPLRAPDVIAAAAGHHLETPVAAGATILDSDGDGRPRRLAMPDGPTIRCAVPADIEGMRLDDPALAQVWRMEVRAAFQEVMASGARVAGVTKDGWYVFTRERKNR